VAAILPFRTGYLRTFNRLVKGTEKIIKHNLKTLPLAYEQVGGFGHLLAITQDPDDPAWEQWNPWLAREDEVRGEDDDS